VADDVHKHYGGVRALRGASLTVRAGEVHGLIGENGSGKSTLLRILSGQALPDRARVLLDGRPLPLGDATRTLRAGIAMVSQETTLVPGLSVAENIMLGRRTERRWYGIDWADTRRQAAAILERLAITLDVRALAGGLRPDEQQMVEVARALSADARVLILDEPTSSLTDDETQALFALVRRLRGEGVATIFVSHRMGEIFELTDRVTVLRDGRTVAARPTAELTPGALIGLMVGTEMQQASAPLQAGHAMGGAARLHARGVTVPGRVHDVSLDVAPGEVVGLAGLVGAGRSDLLRALFGLEPDAGGTIELDGAPVDTSSPAAAMRSGLAYVPADRKLLGLVLDMSTRENLMMARTARIGRLRRPRRTREAELVRELAGRLRMSGTATAGAPVSSLSGGNQQKVVLAKWMGTNPKVLLLDEPTRGVDVMAKGEIYRLLASLRAQGLALVVSSSETPELLLLCDRVLVMYRGRIVAGLTREQATEARIAHYATGHP
jgi:ABC-type sugar transport system ATPase subunit